LTFKENIQDLKRANREHSKFMARFNYELFNTKVMKLVYVSVPEFQERGAIHYHSIIFNMPFVRSRVYSVIRRIWGKGSQIQLKRINSPQFLIFYMYKYMFKNFLDMRLYRKKKYFASRSVLKPKFLYKDVAIEMLLPLLEQNSFYIKKSSFDVDFIGTIEKTVYNLPTGFDLSRFSAWSYALAFLKEK